jgi:hypothetical protein
VAADGPTLHDPQLLVNVAAGMLEGIHDVSPDLGSHSDAFAAFFQARTGIAPTAGSHYYFDAVASSVPRWICYAVANQFSTTAPPDCTRMR